MTGHIFKAASKGIKENGDSKTNHIIEVFLKLFLSLTVYYNSNLVEMIDA